MKKRFLQMKTMAKAVMIALLLGVAGLTNAFAQSFTIDNLNYSINADGVSVTVTGAVNGMFATGSLVIPESVTYEGTNYLVTIIGDWAFISCSGYTGSLTIPDNVTTIGQYAFRGCSGFTGNLVIGNAVTTIGKCAFNNCFGFTGSLIIPNSVTTIGEYAFDNCSGFTGSLIISNSVTTIGDHAFENCIRFTGNLTIPNSVIEIGWYAFENCRGFTGSLTIGNSISIIGNYAFQNCSGFTGDLTIPNSVIEIGLYAFDNCSGFMGNLSIGNSVTKIGSYAFNKCSGFTGDLTIPNSVTEIGIEAFNKCSGFTGNLTISNSLTLIASGVFSDCSGLTGSLTIPNSVITISFGAFYGCSSLTGNLTIPNSVTMIGVGAFNGCIGFTGMLTIGSFVTYIGESAFIGCSGFTEALMFGINPPSSESDVFFDTNFPIYVPYESLDAYKTATNWSNYENRIYPMTYITVSGYGEDTGNWRFIASPLAENTAPTEINDMLPTTGTYDLYRFDQTENAEWRNYKANNFNLVNGQGYLYANAEDVNIIFKGTFNEDETKNVELVYDANASFAGWNLVGNPFPVSAYANKSYYTMNEDGSAIEPVAVSMETAIPACTGVMVKAENTGETVTFSMTAPSRQNNQGVLQIAVAQTNTRVNAVEDKAVVSFNASDRLEKFVFNNDNATLCIPQGGKDFAIAYADGIGEMPLNFKASRNGQYTISVKPENVEMGYLHLIDNLTGTDVDLLYTPNYTFTAKTSDYASRFRLVLSVCEDATDDNETFAFYCNGNYIITNEGEATLQVIDEMGHILSSEHISGSVSKAIQTTPGIYVIRLINGEKVKCRRL